MGRGRAIVLATGVAASSVACHRSIVVERVLPGVSSGKFSELSESTLAALVVCHDTLGRPLVPGLEVAVSRCAPCIPYGLQASEARARAHASRLWKQGGRAPYDSTDTGAQCARLAYRYARALRPEDDALAVEAAVVDLASVDDSVRATALLLVDSTIDAHLARGDKDRAAEMLTGLAMGLWDRAQRQLERPREIGLDALERGAHDLVRGSPLLTHIPVIPATSQALGVSEAVWVARVFDLAARWSSTPADRSRRLRLALAPWVVMEAWPSLDSAARALMPVSPRDSALLPAVALAAYRSMRRPVLESPPVSTLFDSVLAHLPRSDSARYDSFDGILTAEDDEWRYGFFPDQQAVLERRGWAIIDPLWSTPVHEVRLARRARVAEADFRYADIALTGASGSDTRPGQILLRRGAPTPRWLVTGEGDRMFTLERSWSNLVATSKVETRSAWRVFSANHFSVMQASTFVPLTSCPTPQGLSSGYACVMAQRADWPGVPFYGTTAVVDVSVARFRTDTDSVDLYVGARVPLRTFTHREDLTAGKTDRLSLGLWLATEQGAPLYHTAVSRTLPSSREVSWLHQWTARVGSRRMMHRVEALDVMKPAGARGAARFTSDALAVFPVRGFGMSDVLIAASAKPIGRAARRWSDLAIQPNAASVAPDTRFAMVWEVYDLTPGPDGRVRWRVRIKRERGELVTRQDMKEVLVGSTKAGTRVLAAEADASDVSYSREGSPGTTLENIVFGLDKASVGNHVVNVTIDDLVSGTSVTRGVSVRVVTPGQSP